MRQEGIIPFSDRYEEYLGDESKLRGFAQSISFPRTAEEVAAIIRQMAEEGTPVTVQGGKTGICGGAVPLGGHILNLSQMNRALGFRKLETGYAVCVQAGMTLSDLGKRLNDLNFDDSDWDTGDKCALMLLRARAQLREAGSYFWPPEPTETSATVGGVIATRAQGICAPLYGDTAQYVASVTVVDGNANIMTIHRGESKWRDGLCRLPNGAALCRDPAALGLKEDADAIELFIGSEGMFGVIVEATLELIKRPKELWGIAFFFEDRQDLFRFAEELASMPAREGTAAIAAAEYIDRATIDHIAQLQKVATKLKALPQIDPAVQGMVYVELHGEEEQDVERIAEELMDLAATCGCREDTWALSGVDEVEKLRVLRHAAPESINIAVERSHQADARISKLSTDIAMKGKPFGELIAGYQRDAMQADVAIAIFGHILDSHVHVNILAQDYDAYLRGKELVAGWTAQAAKDGYPVFCENGVGKLKRDEYLRFIDPRTLEQLRALKDAFDQKGILNASNLFGSGEEP